MYDVWANFSALLTTLGAFALIMVLARFRIPLGVAILGGSVMAGFLLGLDGWGLCKTAVAGITAPRSIGLAMITILLLVLSDLMRDSGALEKIVSLAHGVLRRPAITMIAMPALIGLLPMPGGAIFSAPMVETASGNTDVPRGLLSAINYWFRHIWEYFWPLYPGVIVAMGCTGLSIPHWTRLMFPGCIAMFLGGLLMLRGTHPDLHAKSEPPLPGTKRKLLLATAPIWVILVVYLPVNWITGAFLCPLLPESIRDDILRYGPMTLGLIVSILWTSYSTGLKTAGLRNAFTKPAAYALALLIMSIMIFQHTLKDVNAAARIAEELKSIHVPMVLVVAILPFIAGFVTGVAVGFVGTAFPIVLSLIGATKGVDVVWVYIPLAYAFGHLGQMLTPIHVCQILSNKYFGTGYGPVYRYMLPTAAVTIILNTGYFLVLLWLFG